jgi:hypothetical protein
MNSRFHFSLWLLVVVALLLVSCAQAGSNPPAAAPGGEATATSAGAGSSGGSQVVVTQADAGKTVQLKVGQQLLVKMGTDYNWKVDVTPAFLLAQVDNAKLGEGEQGLYAAKMNGQATVQATAGAGKQFNINIVISQ